jgi:hypothetical protein
MEWLPMVGVGAWAEYFIHTICNVIWFFTILMGYYMGVFNFSWLFHKLVAASILGF